MKYSYKWLQELSGTKLSPEKAVELLIMHSMEVEGVEKTGVQGNVVVGEILEIKKHPDADKLNIGKVDVGEKAPRQIVFGQMAKIKVGDKMPVALAPTNLFGNKEIREVKLRGELSQGMLCLDQELGFKEEGISITFFKKSAKNGKLINDELKLDDAVFEIKVLPDRAHDAMSHVGVARELAVLEKRKFDYDFEGLKISKKISQKIGVEIRDKNLCKRYIGAVMENVTVKESPKWMRERLESCGIRSINNVVDATNYIMLELGQPLHAFDAEKIRSEASSLKSQRLKKSQIERIDIIVRKAEKNEKMILLDDSEIKLSEDNLLITNGKNPLALAGIMGGKDSGIEENTKTVVLEAANFDAVNIRRSRTKLNVKTESSDRFEKDLDPNLAEKAMARLIEILEHTAGAKLEGIVDVYPKPIKPWKIKLNLDYVNNLLGENVPVKEIIKILNLLGIKTKTGKLVDCEIPTYRLDLRTQEDLIEEIGRVWGYEKIKERPQIEPIAPAEKNEVLFFERKIKKIAASLGFNEIYNYSFYSERDGKICGLDEIKHYELANPMNLEQEMVRASLVPNILKNIRENLKRFEEMKIFEVGRVYYPNNNKVEEKRMLVMAQVLEKDADNKTFFELKGAAENMLERLSSRRGHFVSAEDAKYPRICHPTRRAEIEIGGKSIGIIGEVNPMVLADYKIEKRVAMVEMDIEKLLEASQKEIAYKPISKFPTITRDISLLMDENNTAAKIIEKIKKIGGGLVLSVEIFDVFKKDQKTSLAFHIALGADRTLESFEADEIMKRIIAGLEKELKVEVRK